MRKPAEYPFLRVVIPLLPRGNAAERGISFAKGKGKLFSAYLFRKKIVK
jgi:hypothetical protein